jgi:RNA polymerase sigma-70 factor (ECF subfamily)
MSGTKRDDLPREPVPPDAAIEDVYRREAPRLARFFQRHVAARDDVPDLVQETFARLLGAAPGSALVRPAAYLQRIARNLLFDRSRRSDTRLARFHLPIDEVADLFTSPDQGLAIEADDLMQAYRRAVDALPEKTRQAFLLHRIDGLGYKQIGERLGISVPTVQYHVARALMQIDQALDGE